jgi:hypothetical protein
VRLPLSRALTALGIALLLAALGYVPARADDPEYTRVLDEAVSEFGQSHFTEARALFERAHALQPTARTLRGLGMVEFELRHYVQSLRFLRQALADARRPLTDDLRAKTNDLAQRAERFVARYRLQLLPAEAKVEVDGATAELESDGQLWLDAGEHTLRVSAEGFEPREQKLDALGGSEQELAVQLETATEGPGTQAGGAASAVQAAESAPAEPHKGAGVWPWVVVGASAALMIGGGVLVALAQSDVSKVQDAPKGSRWSDVQSAYDGAPGKSAAGFAMLGVGAAGVTAGLLWHFVFDRKHRDESRVAAAVGPGNVMLRGRF